MFVPLAWLREFTPYDGSATKLADKLTMLGLEVEDIIHPFADLESIIIGYVAECVPHPNSDHLHCCKVDVGDSGLIDIVCGASNVAAGQKVPVAMVGSRLPDGTVIKKAKLRGQPSCGMICSERELDLSQDHSGILVLPDSAVVGENLVDALRLDTEVLDVSVTPNRGDCLSIIGMARETAAAFNLPFNIAELPFSPDKCKPEIEVPIHVEEPELCHLYAGRVISDIHVAPSPLSFRCRLKAVGVRAISNIVDITNYILFECGQPLHSFDLDKIGDGRIIVRLAREGEELVTLDGKTRMLSRDDLCICDNARVIGLAGVMGGKNTEITEESKNVFLESAVFLPQNIRRTSRRLGLGSEASYRFERGVDQQRTIWALNRACALMASMGGGFVRNGLSLAEPRPFVPAKISFHPVKTDEVLGVNIDFAFQSKALEALGCAVENLDHSVWNVIQPSWRHDLTREEDLIEEVGRMYGMDNIMPELPAVRRSIDCLNFNESRYDFWQRLKHWGAGLGLNEVINYSFVGQKDLDFLNLPQEGRIRIINPLSSEQDVLRTALAPGLLQNIKLNIAQSAPGLKLFELAKVFTEEPASETTAAETGMLAILLYGQKHDAAMLQDNSDMDFSDIKGVVENLCAFLHLEKPEFHLLSRHFFLEPGMMVVCEKETIGVLGRVAPGIAEDFLAHKPVWYGELSIDLLNGLHAKQKVIFKNLPIYPSVKRDITVIVTPAIKVSDIIEKINLLSLPNLENVMLADYFEPEGGTERNLTFRLIFRHSGRTLRDAEVDRERERVAEFLRKELGVKI